MPSSSLKKITLKTFEGKIFKVDEVFVNESQKIKCLIEGKFTEDAIPLPNISSETLSKVIEYMKKHAEFGVVAGKASKSDEKSLKAWDAEFMKVDINTLYDLVMVAYNLDIQSHLDLTCQTAADKIKGKTPEQIRQTFNIKSDFTPEEEEKNQRRFPWVYE